MPTPSTSLRDPLARYLDIAAALRETRSWLDDWSVLHVSAIPLVLAPGTPREVAQALRATSEQLKQRTKWWESARDSARIFLAGSLVAASDEPAAFIEELRRAQALFRAAKLPRGDVAEVFAIQLLREATPGRRVESERVTRLAALYRRVKQDHRWLLGEREYPTLALLATTDDGIEEVGARVEAILQALRGRGFRTSSALLAIPHLLYFHPARDQQACERFEALWRTFKARGLRMSQGDYDEVALLALAPGAPAELVADVLAASDRITAVRPKPGRDERYSLASAMTFLQHAVAEPKRARLSHLQAALQVRSVIVARRAAAASAVP